MGLDRVIQYWTLCQSRVQTSPVILLFPILVHPGSPIRVSGHSLALPPELRFSSCEGGLMFPAALSALVPCMQLLVGLCDE